MSRRATSEYNFQIEYPEIAAEWHPTKNGDLKPTDVTPGSNKKIWWFCKKDGHEWESTPGNRKKHSCPACSGRIATPKYNLRTEHPEIAAEWHPTKNNACKPDDFLPHSNKKKWWLCKKGHEWEVTIANRTKGAACPLCNRRIPHSSCNLAICNPEIAEEWHPTKNAKLKPSDILPHINKMAWWLCKKGHEWEARIYSRTCKRRHGCPICAGKFASPDNNLEKLYPEIANEWHPTKNGNLKPSNVTAKSHTKVWWLCKNGHEWKAKIGNRSIGRGCHICSGKIPTPTHNLAHIHPELVKDWHHDNDLDPYEITPRSSYRAKWRCHKCGHEWKTTVASRARGAKCSHCIGRAKKPFKFFTTWLGDIWDKTIKPPYATVGKIDVCEMFQEKLVDLGYCELGFLSLPGNGREIKHILDNNFDFDYSNCLGVERGSTARQISEFFQRLFRMGKIGGIIPIVKADIDKLVLRQTDHILPVFNAVHLDYNGPLNRSHVHTVEAALKDNPDAVVAITVKQIDRFRQSDISYKYGEFPFFTIEPEVLFHQPYQGIKGQWMETYCFRNRKQIWGGIVIP